MKPIKRSTQIFFVMSLNLLVTILLAYQTQAKAQGAIPNTQQLSTPELLDIALKAEEITEEQRLLYLAYSLYEASSLPPQFQSNILTWGTSYTIEIDEAWNNAESGFAPEFSPAVHSELERLLLDLNDFCSVPDSSAPPIVSGDFWVMYEAPTGLDVWDYLNALNNAYDFYITDQGWLAPPLCDAINGIDCRHTNTTGYPIRITHDSNAAGYVRPYSDSGKYNGTVGYFHNSMTPSAFASCMVLNADLTSDPATLPEDLVKITTVHEFFHMIQYGLDGVNDLEDSMWRESGATYMEGVLYPNLSNNYEYLWPEVEQCLGQYPDTGTREYTNWLFFQYASEHYGGQDIVQQYWWNVTSGQEGLAAYNDALLDVGDISLQDLFHEYAVATRYPIPCSSNYCYQNATGYLASAGSLNDHHNIPNVGIFSSIDGEIRDNFAAQWVGLPVEDMPYDVYIWNRSQDGELKASIVEKIPTGIRVHQTSQIVEPGTVLVWEFDPDDEATGITLVLTNQEADLVNMPDPATCGLDPYRVVVSREVTAVTLVGWDVTAHDSHQIKIGWQTEWEGNSEAFQIYRSLSPNAPLAAEWQMVHQEPSANSPMGHYYEWIDTGVQNHTQYYYWLREVDRNGTTETWGPELGITGPPPVINSFTVNNQLGTTLPPKTNFTLAWNTSLAQECYATGRWSGTVATNGSRLIRGFERGARTYTLNCVNQYGIIRSSSVTVTIPEPCTGIYCNPEQ